MPQDPDELYRQREDLASATRAAEIWSTSAADDFEAAWKLARAAYWIGGHAPEGERRAALERGINAGETAARLGPDRPEGHYWLAADMGALAESFGLTQGMKYRSRIKGELERVAAIDPAWEQASAITALGRWYYLVPRLFGGSRSKADEHFRRALEQFPHSVTALLFLAESLTAQKKTAEARHSSSTSSTRRSNRSGRPRFAISNARPPNGFEPSRPRGTSRDDGRPPRGLRPGRVRRARRGVRPQPHSRARRPSRRARASAMGSEIRLTAWTADDSRAEAAFAAVFAEFDRLDALMSVWKDGSDIVRLNAAAGDQPFR